MVPLKIQRFELVASGCRKLSLPTLRNQIFARPRRIHGFQLKTAAFPPNGRIPEIYTCEGEDVPPPLVWSGAPAGTKSFALIVDDPDAPGADSAIGLSWI